jgi:hypothetical protein
LSKVRKPASYSSTRETVREGNVVGRIRRLRAALFPAPWERGEDAAVVRRIDGVGLMVSVLQPYPSGTGYEKPHVWLAQVRGGVLDDLAIGDIRTTG